MKNSNKSTDGSRCCLSITIPSKIIKDAISVELANITKKVSVNGFRKGKIPKKIIADRYTKNAESHVINNLMFRYFMSEVEKKKIDLVGILRYIPGEYIPEKRFTYTVEFEKYPQIVLKSLEDVKIEKLVTTVSDSDIDNVIENLRKRHAIWTTKTGSLGLSDRVILDFSGSIDGIQAPEHRKSNFLLHMGSGHIMPEFEKQLIGHKVGDKFHFDIKFSNTYKENNLKNKVLNFFVFIKKIETCKLPDIDSEFFMRYLGTKKASLEILRSEISKNIGKEVKKIAYKFMRSQVFEYLFKSHKINIPSLLVLNEFNRLTQKTKKIREKFSSDNLKKQAVRNVTTGLIINEVIKLNNLQASEKEINALMAQLASKHVNPDDAITGFKKNKEIMKNIHNIALENLAIKNILKTTKVVERKISLEDLLRHKSL